MGPLLKLIRYQRYRCLKKGEELSIWLKNVWNKLYLWTADEDMKIKYVILEVEFQRMDSLLVNNLKITWKNFQGQDSIPSQVWIHIFSGSFLNWLGVSFNFMIHKFLWFINFMIRKCSIYSFWIIVAWISLYEIRTTPVCDKRRLAGKRGKLCCGML